MSAISYHPGQPAAQVHTSLRRSLKAMNLARKCSVLWFAEVMNRHLYRDLGHSTINQYAMNELGFSKSRTRDFIRLARQLENLPAVREALTSGELAIPRPGKSCRWPLLRLKTPGKRPPRGPARS